MIQILHNPRCGKSREGLALLEASGKEFEIIKYLENHPSKKELKEIIKKIGIKPLKLVRQNETIWKEEFKNKPLSDDEIIDAMIQHPILIERPIVINGNKAIIGRPPTAITTII
ncbi:arsenate reductase (glutaredoxin) [Flavobacterium soli]|uniref:arsenate reductase (glutaredoxin) n=1 Tax=Flavobacterium soli TaxID=344881 RepID=UPI00040EC5FE|nr:arsenate reductase (glutaredoxin) [Flavobacterium soli]